MDGYVSPLGEICDLAERYNAMVMVDDSHAVGFIGKRGRGRPNCTMSRTGSTSSPGRSARRWEEQVAGTPAAAKRSSTSCDNVPGRTCFSNSLAPTIAAASLVVLDLFGRKRRPRVKLRENTAWFRQRMTGLAFDILPGDHPIVPVMFGDAALAARMADLLLQKGVYVIGFSYPVVPMGKARIRAQLSAAHTRDDLERAATAFAEARAELA